MENLRLAVVGVGNMGSFHAEVLYSSQIENAVLVALCDTDKEKRERLALKYPDIRIYSSHKQMLEQEELDGVMVAVPHYEHCRITVDCLEKGLHVLCEKPEAVSVSQARLMNEAAERSGKVYALMFNQRTNPIYAKAKELVEAGVLGKRKRMTWIITNWYRTQAYYNSGQWRATWKGEGGGVLLNQAPHNLDLWQWIFGMPQRVRAFCSLGKYHDIEVEDDVRIFASYDDGATAEFITTTGEFPGTNRLELVGDRAKMVIENGKLKVWRLEIPERQFCFESKKGFAEIPTVYEEYEPREEREGHIAITENFVRAILKGEKLIAKGCEGINELSISNAAYLSSFGDKEISLPLCEEDFDAFLDQMKASSKDKETFSSGESDARCRWQVRW